MLQLNLISVSLSMIAYCHSLHISFQLLSFLIVYDQASLLRFFYKRVVEQANSSLLVIYIV